MGGTNVFHRISVRTEVPVRFSRAFCRPTRTRLVRDPIIRAALGAEERLGVERVVGVVQREAVELGRDA